MVTELLLLESVGLGTLTTKELVAGFVIAAIPPGVNVVFGVVAMVAVLTAVPWETVIELPEVETVGDGTFTTNELVAGLVMFATPPGVNVVFGVVAMVAVLTAVPWETVIELPEVETVGDGTFTTKELVAGFVMFAIPPGVMLVVGETGTVTGLTAVP